MVWGTSCLTILIDVVIRPVQRQTTYQAETTDSHLVEPLNPPFPENIIRTADPNS